MHTSLSPCILPSICMYVHRLLRSSIREQLSPVNNTTSPNQKPSQDSPQTDPLVAFHNPTASFPASFPASVQPPSLLGMADQSPPMRRFNEQNASPSSLNYRGKRVSLTYPCRNVRIRTKPRSVLIKLLSCARTFKLNRMFRHFCCGAIPTQLK